MRFIRKYGYTKIKVLNRNIGYNTIFINLNIVFTHVGNSGYPYGLKRESSPINMPMMAIADVYDALRNKSRYKEQFAHKAL